MRRVLGASYMTCAALCLSGCLGFPAIEVRDNTYDQSAAGKYALAVSSFDAQSVSRNTVQWFSQQCPSGGIGETRDCAVRLGMTCEEGPEVNCFYAAQQTTRRRDRHGPPDSREWRTDRFWFAVTGSATGEGIEADSRRGAEVPAIRQPSALASASYP